MSSSDWDWLKMIPMWDWHELVRKGYPGWDRLGITNEPPSVILMITKGKGKSSRNMAIEFDDMAGGPFYYRDWTDSGIPFVEQGESYRSAFWFSRLADKELFEKTFCK